MKHRTSLNVKWTGEIGRYHVESHSSETPYFVDLCERLLDGRAHGICNCIWFSTKANPNLKKYAKRIPYATVLGHVRQTATECKHIAAANNYDHYHMTMPLRSKLRLGIPS